MNPRLLPLGLFIGLSFSVSTLAAEVIPNDVRVKLMRPCQQIVGQNKERCEQRQLESWRLRESHKPDTALETYDGMDMGKARMKTRLQQERLTENKRYLVQTRRTYREQKLTDDHNTTTRPFLNDYRKQRLKCMTDVTAGHLRTRCLDRIENEMRRNMKTTPLPPAKPYNAS